MNLPSIDLCTVEPMDMAAVNGWIRVPPSLIIMIYCAIICIAMVSAVYFILKKTSFVQAFRKAIIVAFFCSGFLYLVYAEWTWYSWLGEDFHSYSGYSTEEKIKIYLNSFYDFISVAGKVLKDNDYVIYAQDDSMGLMAQYYLLPRRKKANAKNIVVYYDDKASYDYSTGTFVRGEMRYEKADLLYRYDSGAYILRVR